MIAHEIEIEEEAFQFFFFIPRGLPSFVELDGSLMEGRRKETVVNVSRDPFQYLPW